MKQNSTFPNDFKLPGHALLLLLLLLMGFVLQAQQIPISDYYVVNPRWTNPASMGTAGLNNVMYGLICQ